jgi:hypothetical protein
MILSEPIPGKQDPLAGLSRKYAEEHGQNIHQAAAEIDAQAADVDSLPAGMRDARKELERADAIREKAEAKLRAQLAAQNEYQNRLQSIVTLKGEIGLAQTALAEFEFTLKNSVTAHEQWPFLTRQSPGGRYGQWAREFALSISTAREMVLLLPGWIDRAAARLTVLENSTLAFKEKNKLQ